MRVRFLQANLCNAGKLNIIFVAANPAIFAISSLPLEENMAFSSNRFRVFLSFSLIVVFGVATFADTVRLKDGSRVKGKVVGFAGGKFTVAMGEGSRKRQITLDASEIESIEFDSPQTNSASIVEASNRTSRPIEKKQPVEDPPVAAEVLEPVEKVATSAPAVTMPTKKVSFGKPIELSIKVLADNTANGWTNSGWVVRKGQKIRISGTGQVSIGRGKTTGPSGLYDIEDNEKLLKSVPTGALIAVIGDDNNEFIYIGAEREFTAGRDGALFLGLNEGNLNDNTGSFDVKIEISTDGGE